VGEGIRTEDVDNRQLIELGSSTIAKLLHCRPSVGRCGCFKRADAYDVLRRRSADPSLLSQRPIRAVFAARAIAPARVGQGPLWTIGYLVGVNHKVFTRSHWDWNQLLATSQLG